MKLINHFTLSLIKIFNKMIICNRNMEKICTIIKWSILNSNIRLLLKMSNNLNNQRIKNCYSLTYCKPNIIKYNKVKTITT